MNIKSIYVSIILCINIPRVLPLYIIMQIKNKRLILTDLDKKRPTYSFFFNMTFYKHFRNIYYYRIGNLKYLVKWICPEEHSINLPVSTPIGEHITFVHNISSFINAERIGHNFICYQNVTIGTGKGGKRPTIGNSVTVYTGAIIVGGINIGDNVTIGAGSVVTKDIPNNCTVVGNGGIRIIPKY